MSNPTTTEAKALFVPIPYRLRIGVTGHRTLEDPVLAAQKVNEILDKTVEEFFDNLLPKWPRETKLAFTVVTSLAEGADRLVAHEVLKRDESEIEVVLPRAREDYRNDFTSEESRRDFDTLCDRACAAGTLHCVRTARSGPNTGKDDIRHAGYERAGSTVVDRCDILIALWDGQKAHGVGGTGDIVEYARVAKRHLAIVAVNDGCSISSEFEKPLSGAAIRRTEIYNAFKVSDAAFRAHQEDSARRMFGGDAAIGISAEARNLAREQIAPYYSRAALMAEQSKKRYARAGLAAYVLAPAAVAAVAISVLVHELSMAGGILELSMLLAILAIVTHADRHKVHKKWVGARFVAERLRTAMFCVACGLSPRRTGVPPWLLHIGGADIWAYRACDEIARRLDTPRAATQDDFDAIRNFAQGVWFDEQIDYCERRARETSAASHRLETAGKWAFGGAILAAIAHLVLLGTPLGEDLPIAENLVLLLALVLPAVGASLGGIRTHREYSRLEKRHEAMKETLREMRKRFADVETIDELTGLIRETEDIMLQDASEWLALMRYVRIETA
jgi:hypothetical protein